MKIPMDIRIDQEPEQIGQLKRWLVGCFKGARLLRTLVVIACICIVVQQISSCIGKLITIPVTTYTHFDFNKTIVYPSITFCKEPAYKFDRLLNYNLFSHPRYTSTWIRYNFSISLDDLWQDITYNQDDIFVQYGLDGSPDNVELSPVLGFVYGRCYTMTPKTLGTHASKATGFSVTLKHSAEDVATANGIHPPGYHVFVHYTKEPFTEVEVYNGGLVQYLYVSVGESMTVKLAVDEYLKISKEDDPCTFQEDYNANLCTEQYVWELVSDKAGCSGPWMMSDLTRCHNYTSMRNLITVYMNICPRFCKSYLYNSFVMDRKTLYAWDSNVNQWRFSSGDAALQTQLYIYFNSMMVAVYEERYNYDWNLFISDLGGSIGFLLGLSVIGLLKMLGQTWDQFIRPFIRRGSGRRCRALSIPGSTTTADVATIYPDKNDNWIVY